MECIVKSTLGVFMKGFLNYLISENEIDSNLNKKMANVILKTKNDVTCFQVASMNCILHEAIQHYPNIAPFIQKVIDQDASIVMAAITSARYKLKSHSAKYISIAIVNTIIDALPEAKKEEGITWG